MIIIISFAIFIVLRLSKSIENIISIFLTISLVEKDKQTHRVLCIEFFWLDLLCSYKYVFILLIYFFTFLIIGSPKLTTNTRLVNSSVKKKRNKYIHQIMSMCMEVMKLKGLGWEVSTSSGSSHLN
jgi:hypothetical protein